jgi:hypothetical protein
VLVLVLLLDEFDGGAVGAVVVVLVLVVVFSLVFSVVVAGFTTVVLFSVFF